MNFLRQNREGIDLQGTLAASTACSGSQVKPHHPITCPGKLAFHEDGSFTCEHAVAPPDDIRTQYCLDESVALLLIELVSSLGSQAMDPPAQAEAS